MTNIIIPRKEILVPIGLNFGMKGFFRIRTINKFSGKCRIDTGFFPNTILNSGRNIMADTDFWMTWCQVGTNDVFPELLEDRQNETALGGWIDGTNDITSTTNGQSGVAPYYGWKRRVYRFPVGDIGGKNLSEVGVGWGETGSTLISRAPILDPVSHTPTTITPLSDEILEVSYELRYYAPTVDVTTPSVVLDGITYDTVTKACRVTDSVWSSSIGNRIGVLPSSLLWDAWDGAIGTVLTTPNGNQADCDTNGQYNSAYSANSYEMQVNCPTGSTGWNLGAGIRCIRIRTTAGEYQTSFTANPGGATIPKSIAYTMLMSWTLSWAEKV